MSDAQEEQNQVRLLEAQRSRKAAQEDALRLANRVAQLQKEDEKAKKRIQETQKRAAEIRNLRKRNEDHKLEKEALNQQRNRELAMQMEQLTVAKRENERRKQESAEFLARQKREMREMTKGEQAAHERQLAEQRLLERKKALESKEAVRQKQQECKEKQLSEKQKQMEQNRLEYERRLAEEMKEQQKKEKELQKLAQQEMELIERLQHKQLEQRTAYEELESALGLKKGESRDAFPKTSGPVAPEPGLADEPDEQEVAKQFGILDEEGTGFIATGQLNSLMTNLGIALNDAQLEQATQQLDKDNTGKISFGEFLLWWSG